MSDYGKRVYSKISNRKCYPMVKIWENYYDEVVPKGSCIHHIDENKLNNDINNLECMTRGDHMRLHNANRQYKPLSDEAKRKIGDAERGDKHHMWNKHVSDEVKKKMSDAHKGKHHSEETKEKMSIAQKGIKQKSINCPHCGKKGGYAIMKRWHFNNCKSKK